MQLIRSEEIKGKILTLINTSEEFVLLISPNINITKVYDLVDSLRSAESRDIPVKFFIRDHEKNIGSEECLDDLGFHYEKFPKLHFKIYLNESKAIITSLNLLINSMTNSLEIGHITTTKEEYDEVVGFIESTLRTPAKAIAQPPKLDINDIWKKWNEELKNEYKIYDLDHDKLTCRIKQIDNFYIRLTQEGNLDIDGVILKKQIEEAKDWSQEIREKLNIEVAVMKIGQGGYATVRITQNVHKSDVHTLVKQTKHFADKLNEYKKVRFVKI